MGCGRDVVVLFAGGGFARGSFHSTGRNSSVIVSVLVTPAPSSSSGHNHLVDGADAPVLREPAIALWPGAASVTYGIGRLLGVTLAG